MLVRRRLPSLLALAGATCALLGTAASPALADASCTRVAAPGGSDSAAGTVGSPFRTAQKVIEALKPGDTGCLRDGYYADEVNGPFVANFVNGGRPGAPITLRSYPGERARLRGVISIPKSSGYITVSGFDIDGRRPQPSDTPIGIQLMGPGNVVENNSITDSTASCVTLGVENWGYAVNNVIRGNTFHDCGTTQDGMHDHAIYANNARGGKIVDNVILRSAGYAVHFYGYNQGITVAHNVMADNGGGVIFSGYQSRVSDHNVVKQNIIVNSAVRSGIESWWGSRAGRGNVARANCVVGNRAGEIQHGNKGFSMSRNVVSGGSRCTSLVGSATAAHLASVPAAAAASAHRR